MTELILYFIGGGLIGMLAGIIITYWVIAADEERQAKELAKKILEQAENETFGV